MNDQGDVENDTLMGMDNETESMSSDRTEPRRSRMGRWLADKLGMFRNARRLAAMAKQRAQPEQERIGSLEHPQHQSQPLNPESFTIEKDKETPPPHPMDDWTPRQQQQQHQQQPMPEPSHHVSTEPTGTLLSRTAKSLLQQTPLTVAVLAHEGPERLFFLNTLLATTYTPAARSEPTDADAQKASSPTAKKPDQSFSYEPLFPQHVAWDKEAMRARLVCDFAVSQDTAALHAEPAGLFCLPQTPLLSTVPVVQYTTGAPQLVVSFASEDEVRQALWLHHQVRVGQRSVSPAMCAMLASFHAKVYADSHATDDDPSPQQYAQMWAAAKAPGDLPIPGAVAALLGQTLAFRGKGMSAETLNRLRGKGVTCDDVDRVYVRDKLAQIAHSFGFLCNDVVVHVPAALLRNRLQLLLPSASAVGQRRWKSIQALKKASAVILVLDHRGATPRMCAMLHDCGLLRSLATAASRRRGHEKSEPVDVVVIQLLERAPGDASPSSSSRDHATSCCVGAWGPAQEAFLRHQLCSALHTAVLRAQKVSGLPPGCRTEDTDVGPLPSPSTESRVIMDAVTAWTADVLVVPMRPLLYASLQQRLAMAEASTAPSATAACTHAPGPSPPSTQLPLQQPQQAHPLPLHAFIPMGKVSAQFGPACSRGESATSTAVRATNVPAVVAWLQNHALRHCAVPLSDANQDWLASLEQADPDSAVRCPELSPAQQGAVDAVSDARKALRSWCSSLERGLASVESHLAVAAEASIRSGATAWPAFRDAHMSSYQDCMTTLNLSSGAQAVVDRSICSLACSALLQATPRLWNLSTLLDIPVRADALVQLSHSVLSACLRVSPRMMEPCDLSGLGLGTSANLVAVGGERVLQLLATYQGVHPRILRMRMRKLQTAIAAQYRSLVRHACTAAVRTVLGSSWPHVAHAEDPSPYHVLVSSSLGPIARAGASGVRSGLMQLRAQVERCLEDTMGELDRLVGFVVPSHCGEALVASPSPGMGDTETLTAPFAANAAATDITITTTNNTSSSSSSSFATLDATEQQSLAGESGRLACDAVARCPSVRLPHLSTTDPVHRLWEAAQPLRSLVYTGAQSTRDHADYVCGDDDEVVPESAQALAMRLLTPEQRSQWTTTLRERALVPVPVAQGLDGNSLFRCLAHQAYGTQDAHGLIRLLCSSHILCHAKLFAAWLGSSTDVETYVAMMATDASPADAVMFVAAAMVFGARIEVYSPLLQRVVVLDGSPFVTRVVRRRRCYRIACLGHGAHMVLQPLAQWKPAARSRSAGSMFSPTSGLDHMSLEPHAVASPAAIPMGVCDPSADGEASDILYASPFSFTGDGGQDTEDPYALGDVPVSAPAALFTVPPPSPSGASASSSLSMSSLPSMSTLTTAFQSQAVDRNQSSSSSSQTRRQRRRTIGADEAGMYGDRRDPNRVVGRTRPRPCSPSVGAADAWPRQFVAAPMSLVGDDRRGQQAQERKAAGSSADAAAATVATAVTTAFASPLPRQSSLAPPESHSSSVTHRSPGEAKDDRHRQEKRSQRLVSMLKRVRLDTDAQQGQPGLRRRMSSLVDLCVQKVAQWAPFMPSLEGCLPHELLQRIIRTMVDRRVLSAETLPRFLDSTLVSLDVSQCDHVNDAVCLGVASRCPQLRHLCMRRCIGVGSEGVAAVARGCPHLETLDVEDCFQVGDVGLIQLCKAMQTPAALRSLCISGCLQVTDSGLQNVFLTCKKLRTLRGSRCTKVTNESLRLVPPGMLCLELVGCHSIDDTGVLIALQRTGATLHELRLGSKAVTDTAVLHVFQRCKDLRALELRWASAVTHASVQHVVQLHALQELCLADCTSACGGDAFDRDALLALRQRLWQQAECAAAPSGSAPGSSLAMSSRAPVPGGLLHALQCLDVTRSAHFGDTALQSVAAQCPNLRHVVMNACEGVGDAGISALQHCEQLQRVEASGCRSVGDVGVCELVSHCAHIRCLHVANTGITDAALTHTGHRLALLEQLEVSGCAVSDTGLVAIADGCASLRHLVAEDVSLLTDVGIGALRACARLSHVNVSHCSLITDAALQQLGVGCPLMEHFNASHCNRITHDALQHTLLRWGSLKHLTLRGYHGWSDQPLSHPTLQHVDVSWARNLTDDALVALGSGCPCLSQVDIAWCTAVTDQGVRRLARRCNHLTVLNVRGCSSVHAVLIQHLRACGKVVIR